MLLMTVSKKILSSTWQMLYISLAPGFLYLIKLLSYYAGTAYTIHLWTVEMGGPGPPESSSCYLISANCCFLRPVLPILLILFLRKNQKSRSVKKNFLIKKFWQWIHMKHTHTYICVYTQTSGTNHTNLSGCLDTTCRLLGWVPSYRTFSEPYVSLEWARYWPLFFQFCHKKQTSDLQIWC